MKLFNHSIKSRVLWLLASCMALIVSTPLITLHAQKSRDEIHSITKWEHSEDGLKRRVEIRGKAEFTEDYTDIRDVSDGGWIVIEERKPGHSLRYEVRRDVSGVIARTFYVNGLAREFDDTAKKWVAKFVLDVVRQGGFDAEKRVARILERLGITGVLAEIDQISGDYAKRRYYEALIKQANLDATALRDVLKQVARDISSDYEQAQLLIELSPMLTGKEQAIQPFFDAVATINSDYEHGRVLKVLLRKTTPSSAVLILVAGSTKNIASDYERRGVLSALVKSRNPSEEVLRMLLDAATEIGSDYEKATLLVEISNVYTGDARLRSLFLKAVESIRSEYERGRVLSTLLKNKQIS